MSSCDSHESGGGSVVIQGGFLLRHDFEKPQKVPKDPLFFHFFFLWRLLDTEI